MKRQMKSKTEPDELDQPHQRAIKRLRDSKATLPQKLRSAGRKAGQEFVLENSVADALCQCRLEKFVEREKIFLTLRDLANELFLNTDESAGVFTIQLAHYKGAEVNTYAWVDGFIKGALEKFRELEKYV